MYFNNPSDPSVVQNDIHCHINPLKTRNPIMGTLANSEDPDEMPHRMAFHQGLHCLLLHVKAKLIFGERNVFLGNYNL